MDLNDDCWTLILEQLDQKDQFAAAQACERFRVLLCPLWQRSYKNLSLYKEELCEGLDILLRSICNTVQEMEIDSLADKEWSVVKSYSYPNLISLSLEGFYRELTDECVLKMTKICPKLRSLEICGTYISGRHIECWKNLEILRIWYSNSQIENFEKTLEELELKELSIYTFRAYDSFNSELAFRKFCKLEKLCLGVEWRWLADLRLFSNLKMLHLLAFDLNPFDDSVLKVVKDVVKSKHNDLVEVYAGYKFPVYDLFVRSFENLKKIQFYNQFQLQDFDFITDTKQAPNLREIVFFQCFSLQSKAILKALQLRQVQLITVENTDCYFSELRLNVMDIVKHRTTALQFNFYENTYKIGYDVILVVQGESNLLKITSKILTEDDPDEGRLHKIHFR